MDVLPRSILEYLKDLDPQFVFSQSDQVLFFLIENGYDVARVDAFGNTVLHRACQTGNYRRVVRLVNEHDDLRTIKNSKDETPLLLSASLGDLDIFAFLWDKEDASDTTRMVAMNVAPDLLPFFGDLFRIYSEFKFFIWNYFS